MNKILKNHTIIPQHLYVERSADKQLKNIIDDMGRPGYILVARQMGKTNLLINAKRRLEKEGDIYVYIDLSNKFDDVRECFRNIIDVICDTNEDKLESLYEEICHKRNSINLSPHKEHSAELKKIIKAINGKLIICLDEIDSLTLADYSDKIFAQIRSVYFERINFKEFERLNYVLSGVAEPSEIIKDRSISPFNIGQKIFLSDFSKVEFYKFIQLSGLKIDNKVSERVFDWVNGNPRLTWEVCSELEDIIAQNVDINESDVDNIINKMYLTNFDRPPIDHIRTLISTSQNLRSGLKNIHNKQFDKLTDEIKNKLYLAGILSSEYEDGKIQIKNKIIESSIDVKWLEEISKQDAFSLRYGIELKSSGNYEEAIDVFEKILEEENLSKEDKLTASISLGSAYMHVGRYREAIVCFNENRFDKELYKAPYIEQIHMTGVCCIKLGDYKEAVQYFEEVLAEGSSYYFESFVNLASSLMKIESVNSSNRIEKLMDQVIKECPLDHDSYNEIIPAAYIISANLKEISGDEEGAIKTYEKASNIAADECSINPLVSAYRIRPNEEFQNRIIKLMSKDGFKLSKNNTTFSHAFDSHNFTTLTALSAQKKSEKLLSFLVDFAINYKSDNGLNLTELLVQAAMIEIGNSDIDSSTALLMKIVSIDTSQIRSSDYFISVKWLLFITRAKEYEYLENHYFQGVQNYVNQPDLIDVRLFEEKINSEIINKNRERALALSNLILGIVKEPTLELKVMLIRIYYLRINCLSSNNEVINESNNFINLMGIAEQQHFEEARIDSSEAQELRLQIETLIHNIQSKTSFIDNIIPIKKKFFAAGNENNTENKSIGRNQLVKVKYGNGNIMEKKYKQVQSDIKSGKCKVV